MSEPSSRSLEQARNLISQLNRGEPCDPNDDDIIPTALALDAARAEERERCEQIALRYKLESYIAEQIANAIHNEVLSHE